MEGGFLYNTYFKKYSRRTARSRVIPRPGSGDLAVVPGASELSTKSDLLSLSENRTRPHFSSQRFEGGERTLSGLVALEMALPLLFPDGLTPRSGTCAGC